MTHVPTVLATMARYVDAVVSRDSDAVSRTLAEDHRFEDRRLGMKSTLDKAGNLEQIRVLWQLANDQPFSVDVDVIETRGDLVALVRQVYRNVDYAIAFLGVIEVDSTGLTRRFIVFDENDLQSARSELELLSAP